MNKKKKYDHGCVMLNLAFPTPGVHSYIQNSHVYHSDDTASGLECTPHITLLYGIHKDVPLVKVLNALEGMSFDAINIGKVSKFEAEHYDVLKFTAESDQLHACNKKLKTLDHTSKFKDYIPHVTIGYLKKGFVDYYIAVLKNFKIVTYPQYATYSTPDGDLYKIPIKLKIE